MAELDLKLPNLRQGATAEENVQELYNYLKKQNEKLKYILNNLDVDSFNDDVKIQLNAAVKLAESNAEVINTTAQLEQVIKNTADTVNYELNEQIEEIAGQIRYISETLGAEAVYDLNTQRIQSALGVALKTEVNEVISAVLGANGTIPEGYEVSSKYEGYVELGYNETEGKTAVSIAGKSDTDENPMTTLITPDKIIFKIGDRIYAYFGNKDMFIDAVRTNKLKVGKRTQKQTFFFENEAGTYTDNTTPIATMRLKYDVDVGVTTSGETLSEIEGTSE